VSISISFQDQRPHERPVHREDAFPLSQVLL
jgi:hypothetical protein